MLCSFIIRTAPHAFSICLVIMAGSFLQPVKGYDKFTTFRVFKSLIKDCYGGTFVGDLYRNLNVVFSVGVSPIGNSLLIPCLYFEAK